MLLIHFEFNLIIYHGVDKLAEHAKFNVFFTNLSLQDTHRFFYYT